MMVPQKMSPAEEDLVSITSYDTDALGKKTAILFCTLISPSCSSAKYPHTEVEVLQ